MTRLLGDNYADVRDSHGFFCLAHYWELNRQRRH